MFHSPPLPETGQRRPPRLIGAIRVLVPLVILGALVSGGRAGQAATPSSDWPALNADGSQSNYNAVEKSISASNVLKLKVKWVATLPDLGYPVVAGGHVYVPTLAGKAVHARSLDITNGKQSALFTSGAIGGLLVANGSLYLAGRSLVQVDPSSGEKLGQVKGNSTSTHATFTFPLADSKLILSGYASDSRTIPNSLYGITPSSGQVVWKIPSMNAQGVLTGARVIALDAAGSVFYNETTGQPVATQKSLFSDWFAGDSMMFTVASVGKKGATLYAYGSGGKKAWAATVGPRINTQGWPHAVDGTGVYVAMMTPRQGVEGFDPHTGSVLWRRALPAVQRLAAANGLVFVLTAGIGQTLKLVVLHADTGKPVGQLALTGGYYAFPTNNELMIAGGMVFIRAVGPTGSTVLVALGR